MISLLEGSSVAACLGRMLGLHAVFCCTSPKQLLGGSSKPSYRSSRQIIHRDLRTALPMRNGRKVESHFHARERAAEHELVEIAEMADAKNFASDLAKTLP